MNYPAPGYVPQQQYPPQPPVQQPPVQQPQFPAYPQQQAPQYPPQQYGQAPGYPPAPPQQPAVPLATGSIDDYYGQPSAGGGPSISWKDKPIGHWYAGVVARDVTDADIQQQTDPQTKQPKFFRDGRPQFVMKVPLKVEPSVDFPDGEATLFVRGQMRDELVRAMAESGSTGAPKAGATIIVQLAGKRNTGAIPANQFAIQYQPPAGQGAGAASPAPAQQPVQQAPVQQQPLQTIQNGDQFVQGQPQQQVPTQPQFQQPVAQAVPQPIQQAPVQQQAPAQPAPAQPPADFNAEQQALLARLTQQPQAQPA
jgi:hypothetical protein